MSFLQVLQRHRARRVAGDDQHLDLLLDQKLGVLERGTGYHVRRLRAVGIAAGVAEVDEVLIRKQLAHRAHDGEAADAGVEDADRSGAVGWRTRLEPRAGCALPWR